MDATDVVLVADIGKSRCRVELRSGDELLGAADQHGFPGVHVENGPTLAFDLVLETTTLLPPGLPVSTLTGVGTAVAGVEASDPYPALHGLARIVLGRNCKTLSKASSEGGSLVEPRRTAPEMGTRLGNRHSGARS